MKKVIVIGLDGLEPKIVDALRAAGELPNFGRLAAQGGIGRVATTTPAQTPVAWSTFATGTNPGEHGIFDFLRRDPATYLPNLALNRYETRGAFLPPRAVNLRRGSTVWDVLAGAGIASTVIRCPVSYPPEAQRGRLLSGMGVPDLRGGFGTPTFYTTAAGETPGESEQVVTLQPEADGSYRTYLNGPRAAKGPGDLRFEFTIVPDGNSGRVAIRSGGYPTELTVSQGSWSEWLLVRFKPGLLQSIRGMVRFHLVRLGATLELYASPVNFDPESPLFPISHPPDYARELADELGPYHTTGMVEDHTGIINGRLSEEAFLDQCDLAWREREAMLFRELSRFDSGFLYCLFDTPDRVQHMFWRFREPDHPANRAGGFRPELARVVEDQYRRSDTILGHILEAADDRTLVIALSDHGFGSFRRGVNLNTILLDLGLLALKDGARPGPEAGDLLRGIDWSRTSAYAVGLGGIYLNRAGREAQGIVGPDAATAVSARITTALQGLADPAGTPGLAPVRRVRTREQVYSGSCVADAPDLLVDFAEGYRASWGTSLGGVPSGHFEDNVKKWGGDHIIDPVLVPGVLLMNRPFRSQGADMTDLAPTILDALGVPKGPVMEGSSLRR